jgi:hypothetical protein
VYFANGQTDRTLVPYTLVFFWLAFKSSMKSYAESCRLHAYDSVYDSVNDLTHTLHANKIEIFISNSSSDTNYSRLINHTKNAN